MTIGQGHGNTLESYGYRGGPMGTAVEICWNGNMSSDTTVGGSLTGKATRRLAIWLLGNFCEEWRVVLEASLTHSRSVASARSTDPVGSHSAESRTRIHCHESCAGATCQPAPAPTSEQCDTSPLHMRKLLNALKFWVALRHGEGWISAFCWNMRVFFARVPSLHYMILPLFYFCI